MKSDDQNAEAQVEGEPDQPKIMRRFKVVRALFHYAQVAGEGDLPSYVPPSWDQARAVNELHLREEPFAMYDGNIMGYSYDRTFAVSPVAPYPLKTTIHEIGHIEAGHTSSQIGDHPRGLQEFQAEATAYLTMHQLGAEGQMDTSESRAYIQHWLAGGEPSEVDVRQVFSATDRIVKAGEEQNDNVIDQNRKKCEYQSGDKFHLGGERQHRGRRTMCAP